MNVYAIVAWLKACVINGWLGTPVLNPELDRAADRQRRLDRKTRYGYINHRVIIKRLRMGYWEAAASRTALAPDPTGIPSRPSPSRPRPH
jgi:hypothetical protein